MILTKENLEQLVEDLKDFRLADNITLREMDSAQIEATEAMIECHIDDWSNS